MISNVSNVNNNYQPSNKGLNREELQGNITKSTKAVSDNIGSSSLGQTVLGASDPKVMQKTILMIPPLMILDSFIENHFGETAKGGILNKVANFGDKIYDSLHLEKIFSKLNKNKKSIGNFINNNRFTKYFTNDFKAIGRSSMTKSETLSRKLYQDLTSNLTSMVKIGEENGENVIKQFSKAARNKEAINNIIAKLSPQSKKILGKLIQEDSKEISKVSSKELISVVDDMVKNGVSSLDGGKLNVIKTKLKAAENQIGKTVLGNGFAKGIIKSKDIITYGGGLISMGFMASSFLQAHNAAKEAPKGEKVSTFMHVLSEQYVGLLLLQPSLNILYKIAGNKYRGMTKEGRNALKTLIKKSSANPNLSSEAIKVANIQEKLLIKGVDKDKVAKLAGKTLEEAKKMAASLNQEGAKLKIWEKPLKSLGKFLSVGLDTIKKRKGPTLKGFAGGFLRLILVLAIIQPFIQKPVTKLIHKIFGEPKAYLEKEKQKEAASNSETNQTQKTGNDVSDSSKDKQNSTQEKISDNKPNKNTTNLIEKYSNDDNTSVSSIPINNVNSQTPSTNSNEVNAASKLQKDKNDSNDSGYIPKVEPVKVQDNEKEIEQQVQEILKQTDNIVKQSKKLSE